MTIAAIIKGIVRRCRYYLSSPRRYAVRQGVKIGKDCIISTKGFGSEPYLIEIGDHVQITNGVRFLTHGGSWCLRLKYPYFDCFGKIKIGNNVYIGNNVLIMPGVTIGNNVIIGAGSIVTKSVDSGLVVAGNPAKVISTVEEYELKITPYNLNIKNLSPKAKKVHLLAMSEEKFMQR